MSLTPRLVSSLVLLALFVGSVHAADPAAADPKSLDKAIVDSLRDVHNYGADLYNQFKDYAGSYRVYEGALKTVRPLLGHHPEIQKTIDSSLAAASAEADPARRAFLLHESIEKVRSDLKGGGAAKTAEPKQPVEPKKVTEPKKPMLEPGAKGGAAAISGTVTYKGKPLAEGTVTFVSIDRKKPKVAVGKIKDGQYQVKNLPAGKYAVIITAEKDGNNLLPAKYATTDTSGLRVEVKDGSNTLDFDLT